MSDMKETDGMQLADLANMTLCKQTEIETYLSSIPIFQRYPILLSPSSFDANTEPLEYIKKIN